MATFKICVQKQRKDGFWPVYIRVTHHAKVAYIRTDKMVSSKGITKTREVKDPYVLQQLAGRILEYSDTLNRQDITSWSVRQVTDYLTSGTADICFSDYARRHIMGMRVNGQERNARNYELALQHLERYAGTTRVMFGSLTSYFVTNWIASMASTHRAKEMYPVCMRQVFRAALLELNDYDNGIIRIRTNPWPKVRIPSADRPEKLAITPEECRAFFSAPVPESRMRSPLPELGRDVAMMVLCLAGINAIDLYNLRKSDYRDGIIHYRRAKTARSRTDGAYFEMRVPAILLPIFEAYAAPDDTEYLFCFRTRYSSSDSFGANVNAGIKKICASMGIPRRESYSVYTFRHTWGTVAQNDCGASISEVAFAMNHSQGFSITRGYIKTDFSPAWELNEKVVDLIFFTEEKSHRTQTGRTQSQFRISAKQMTRGEAFFRGRKVAQLQDIGFGNVEEVIAALVRMLPDDIPPRCSVQFRIVNCDKQQTVVYDRQKGKGF